MKHEFLKKKNLVCQTYTRTNRQYEQAISVSQTDSRYLTMMVDAICEVERASSTLILISFYLFCVC